MTRANADIGRAADGKRWMPVGETQRGDAWVVRDRRLGMSSKGGRDVTVTRNAMHAETLEGFARDLRSWSDALSEGESPDPRGWANPLANERIVGYQVAAALNEVAAALLRCA